MISYPFQWVKLNSAAINQAGTLQPLNKQTAVKAVQEIIEAIDSKSLSFSVYQKVSNIPNAGTFKAN